MKDAELEKMAEEIVKELQFTYPWEEPHTAHIEFVLNCLRRIQNGHD